jgi:hypothetical protein
LLYFSPPIQWVRYVLLAVMIFSKFVKQLPHYVRDPCDCIFIPVSILFGYFHGLIKLYGLCTLHEVCLLLHGAAFLHVMLTGQRHRRPGAVARARTRTTRIA